MADIVPTAPRGLLEAIPGLKQAGLLAGVAAAVAAAIWLVLWSQGQNYTVLYGQLSERESGQVMDALTAAGIEYKLSPSGAVSVPESKVQEARIRLASQGLPQSDSMGIEMIQKESALGTSSMMESARYQSVLETELARTIIKVQGVQSARVHLALPKPSVFLRDAHKATASVMLQLYPGRRLEPGQVAAIVHLVASSVPELGGERRDPGGPGGLVAQLAGRERGGRRQQPPARVHAQVRGELSAAHRRAARAHGRRRAACARRSPPTSISPSPRRRTRTTTRRRRRCAANKPPTRCARAATASKAFPARSATNRRELPGRRRSPAPAPTPGTPGHGHRRRHGPFVELAAQHAQFRGRPHLVVRQAAGRQPEAPERRRGAR